MQVERLGVDRRFLEGRVPDRQRVEVGPDAAALPVRRLHRAVAGRRQAELLRNLAVELQGHWLRARQPGHLRSAEPLAGREWVWTGSPLAAPDHFEKRRIISKK